MIHELKTEQQFFDELAAGKKNFETRLKDRPFKHGDFLALNEWKESHYTGRMILMKVNYILDNPEYCKDGYITMALEPCRIVIRGEPRISDLYSSDAVPIYEN